MGGLKKQLPAVYWPFLAGALCLAGFPGSGGFFSKDAVLGAVFERGGPLYGTLFAVGLVTALLTAFYTFRMLFVVFHGDPAAPAPNEKIGNATPLRLPAVMTVTMMPLALLGLFGGTFDLPAYLGSHGLLSGFLGPIPGFSVPEHTPQATEIVLQIIAATVSLLGLGLAWSRYTGQRREESMIREKAGLTITGFLLNGWYLDGLYRLLFIRPFVRLSRFLWKGVDEAAIDGTLNGLGRLTLRLGEFPAGWSTGRVATSLIALAGGATVVLGYVVWSLI